MKLKYDKLLSNFAFNCNLRHYNMEPDTSPFGTGSGSTGVGGGGGGGGGGSSSSMSMFAGLTSPSSTYATSGGWTDGWTNTIAAAGASVAATKSSPAWHPPLH